LWTSLPSFPVVSVPVTRINPPGNHLAMLLIESAVGIVKGTTRGEDRPEEKEWERVLDCLSLGLCQLFECFTPH
jgi:hypothetical protein